MLLKTKKSNMKKLILIMGIALLAFSCTTKSYKIDGIIENATDQMVYLKTMVDRDLIIKDSTMMESGKFAFKGSVEVPDLFAIDFKLKGDRIILFVENSEILITGNAENIVASEIKGSKAQDLLLEFNALQEELAKPLMDIQYKFQSAAMDGSLTPEMEEQLRNEYMTESETLADSAVKFVKENPNSVVSAYITLTQLANQISFEELQGIVNGFSKEISESPFVIALNEKLELELKTAEGQAFMDFSHPDKDGNTVSFSSVTGKNYVLLDFWAGWCGPCRKENPNLVKLYNEYNAKGFDIFGVSLDRDRKEWLDAIEADGLTWNHVSDISGWENSIAKMYGVQSIPANFLISPEGKIIAKNLRGEELAQKLAELLN